MSPPPQLSQSAPPASGGTQHHHNNTTSYTHTQSAPPGCFGGGGGGGGTHHTTTRNPDGSSNIYVHHMNNAPPPPPPQQPQMQMPQMMGIPYPMPTPPPMYAPYPYPPPPSSYGCPYHHQQQQQQQQQPKVVIIKQDEEKPKEDKKKDKPKDKPKEKTKPPPPPKQPQPFSKFSITSVITFFLGLIFGVACVVKTYDAEEMRSSGIDTSSEEFNVARTVAMGTGAAATLCFTIATLCSFYSGLRAKSKGTGSGHVCLGGFVIAGWIIFCLTFITNLIILIIAFDGNDPIYPECVWAALIGSIISWMLMFGYSEISRRAYVV